MYFCVIPLRNYILCIDNLLGLKRLRLRFVTVLEKVSGVVSANPSGSAQMDHGRSKKTANWNQTKPILKQTICWFKVNSVVRHLTNVGQILRRLSDKVILVPRFI